MEQVARGQGASGAIRYNPMTHLRDTVVFGYLMATPKNGRVDVPDWCASDGTTAAVFQAAHQSRCMKHAVCRRRCQAQHVPRGKQLA